MRLSFTCQIIPHWTAFKMFLNCFDRYYTGIGWRICSYSCLQEIVVHLCGGLAVEMLDMSGDRRGIESCLSTETLRRRGRAYVV